ncbi:hypothetical protein MesoLjLc_03890 [Mesorhizobium sp. L-8-10]|nr:hypothetical protein MesoLjLc_03890 [Mesorhizobium sp. L-8-10]
MTAMRSLSTLLLVFLLIGIAPLVVTSDFWLNVVIMTLYAALLGQAWNILGGYGGQFSFGHAAFFGTGAYAVAVLQVQLGINPWIGMALGGVLAAAVAAFIGFCTFRYGLRGSYFALVTLAFAEVLRILSNSVDFTGAGVGLLIPLARGVENFQFASRAGYFWVVWALALAAFVTVWWIGNSRFGAQLTAVRDNEEAAARLASTPSASRWARLSFPDSSPASPASSTRSISSISTLRSLMGRRSPSPACSCRSSVAWGRFSGRFSVPSACMPSPKARAAS